MWAMQYDNDPNISVNPPKNGSKEVESFGMAIEMLLGDFKIPIKYHTAERILHGRMG